MHQYTTPYQTERYSRPRHLAASFPFPTHAKNKRTPLPNRPIRWRTLYLRVGLFVSALPLYLSHACDVFICDFDAPSMPSSHKKPASVKNLKGDFSPAVQLPQFHARFSGLWWGLMPAENISRHVLKRLSSSVSSLSLNIASRCIRPDISAVYRTRPLRTKTLCRSFRKPVVPPSKHTPSLL